MEDELTVFLWTVVLPFLWLMGLPLTVNLLWIRVKAINFSYIAFLILGIYFTILYFQGEEWTIYAWIVILLSFWFVDRRFSLHYDFLIYVWRRKESYKKERKQSRWNSWRDTRAENRRWKDFREKNYSDFKNRSSSDYESKRERTYPKDESQNFEQEKTQTENEKWADVDTMSMSEIKNEWNSFFKITDRILTKEENERMKLLRDSMKKRKTSFFHPPDT